MEPLRLSPSRINDFINCPQLYKYRAIDQLPEPPSLEAERGKLIHAVLEDLFELPAVQRNLPSAIEILPLRWQEAITKNPLLTELIDNEKEWIDRAEALLTNYFEIEKPHTFESTYRELHLENFLSEEMYLHGYVDRLDIAPTGEVRIVDYKTGKSPKPGWEEKALFQLRIYALLYWKKEGVLPTLLQLIYLGDSQVIKSGISEIQLEATERKLRGIGDEILSAIAENYFPPRTSKLCDWCYFKSICPAHNRELKSLI